MAGGETVGAGEVPLAAGGHDEALDGWDEAASGFAVRVKELDHRAEAAAREILNDVMAEQAAGTFSTAIRYRGRREGYWLRCLSPDVLGPRYFGLFSVAGALLGWFSLESTFGNPANASLGIVVKPPWRDRGLGTAAVRHALARKGALLAKPVDKVFVSTMEGNARIIRISNKLGLHDLGMLFDATKGTSVRTFVTSPLTAEQMARLPRRPPG